MTQLDLFSAAEARFRWIAQQRITGQMDDAAYRAALDALRVQDAQGRWWAMQEGTGSWMVWQGNQWVLTAPPTAASPVAPPPAAATAPVAGLSATPAPSERALSLPPGRGLGMGVALYGALIVGVWGLISAALYIWMKPFESKTVLALGVVAGLLLIMTLFSLFEEWEGELVDFRQVRERQRTSSGGYRTRTVTYAFIQTAQGKMKKLRPKRGWAVGNYFVKRKGEVKAHNLG